MDISLFIKKCGNFFNNNENNIQVPYIKYYRTFHTKFDLKFQQCQIDICDTCNKLNSESKTVIIKIILKKNSKKHLTSANQFYKSIKINNNESVLKFSFNLQKQILLPKSNNNINYYSRKVCLYNIGIS